MKICIIGYIIGLKKKKSHLQKRKENIISYINKKKLNILFYFCNLFY